MNVRRDDAAARTALQGQFAGQPAFTAITRANARRDWGLNGDRSFSGP
jgi:hypothetical protein